MPPENKKQIKQTLKSKLSELLTIQSAGVKEINPAPNEARLPENRSMWLGKLMAEKTITVIFTNSDGNFKQGAAIAKGATARLPKGEKMAVGITSVPDNEENGRSRSVIALRQNLGQETRLPGTATVLKSGLGHKDTGIDIDPNRDNEHLAYVMARSAGRIEGAAHSKRITPDEARYIGNFMLLGEQEVADLTGHSVEQVSGGSAYVLTGLNVEHGTTEWEQIAQGTPKTENNEPITSLLD